MEITVDEWWNLVVREVAEKANPATATTERLMEEVAKYYLALRGKHADDPTFELLQIATIAINMLAASPPCHVWLAYYQWLDQHGSSDNEDMRK